MSGVARLVSSLAALLAVAALAPEAHGFTYQPHGVLKPGSGSGQKSTKDYVPGMRFPIEKAPAYANSQVYMNGGYKGPGGGQCDKVNYSYPWWDNFCEVRSWSMPLCPSGKGHQGQDIRPGSCKFNTWWAVASEAGTITSIGTYSVYLKSVTGVTHRYLHLKMSALAVKVGQKVSKGQKLGLVDNDFGGTPTTLHLHYDRKKYVSGVGTVYVPTYASLVNSYKQLIGASSCDASACSKKSSCGSWGACGGFTSTCDTTGTRKRTCTTYACSGGACKSSSKTETQACTRKTDGVQVKGWSGWSACQQTGSGCSTAGSRSRSRQVCKGGKTTTVTEKGGCSVKTDGKVVQGWGAWSACGGFDGACDESGTKARSRKVCKAGQPTTDTATAACSVSTDGKPVGAWGPWSPCGGFEGVCDESGTQSRVRDVCQGGKPAPEVDQRACTVSREGTPVSEWGPWSDCMPDVQPCSAEGTRRRVRQVCKAGAPVLDAAFETCVPACAGDGAGGPPRDTGEAGIGDASAGPDGAGLVGAAVPASPGGGCSGGAPASPVAPWLLLLAALALALRRRRYRA